MKRREFLEASLGAGTGILLLSPKSATAQPSSVDDDLNVAVIGAGIQGRALVNAAMAIPNLRFRAICDVWGYSRRVVGYFLKRYKHEPNEYTDYREMLDKEKDLDAAIVATPDFLHAEHTIACLKSGQHVYCERAMSNSLDAAKSMVQTAREKGKLLQIGYQRRSNSRYQHVHEKLLGKAKLVGRITQTRGQWSQPARDDIGWPKRFAIPEEELKRYGYDNMHQFRNWRSFKRTGGGPFADYGAHQVDVVNWLLDAKPKSVLAGGGIDYYDTREWFDNATAIVEYETPDGTVRGTFQVLTATSGDGVHSFQHVMGADGSIRLSENPKWTAIFREAHAPDWDEWVSQGYLKRPEGSERSKPATSEEEHVRETGGLVAFELPVVFDKPSHQPHLANFFDAIRGKAKLNCPADEAYNSEVVVHKVNEAIETGQAIAIEAADYGV